MWSALPIGRLGCLSTAGIRRRLLVAQRRTERSAYLPRASSLLRALGPSALAVSGRSVCLGVSQYPRRVLYCSLSSESAQPLCTNEPALSLRCSAHRTDVLRCAGEHQTGRGPHCRLAVRSIVAVAPHACTRARTHAHCVGALAGKTCSRGLPALHCTALHCFGDADAQSPAHVQCCSATAVGVPVSTAMASDRLRITLGMCCSCTAHSTSRSPPQRRRSCAAQIGN